MALRRHYRLQDLRRSLLSFAIIFVSLTSSWGTSFSQTDGSSPTTNPVDLQVLHEMMYSLNFEEDWNTYFPDPCVSGPQGILCEPDPVTGVLFVTQLQFGYISPIDNIIPCSFNASIPSSIAKLTRLDTLAFYSCFVNSTATIPEEITLLGPTLRLLSLRRNPSLTGTIPAGIGKLTGLQRLVLSQNGLQGEIPAELSNLQNLIQLDLSHNNLSGSIPATLSTMDSLVNLDLRYNQLDGEFPAGLGQGFGHLQRLAASYNKLSGSLPDTFTGLKYLTFLDLSYNHLMGNLPPSLGNLANLQDLFLNSNSLDGEIPESLGSLIPLKRLDLSSCGFVGLIPDSLKGLQNLRYLSVSNNHLSGPIPASLASLPVLFTLNLDGNQLSGAVPFPSSFIQKMGRNMLLNGNPGLCYTPQLVTIKMLLGLNQCPDLQVSAPVPPAPAPATSPNGSWKLTISFQLGIVVLVSHLLLLHAI